MRSGANLSPNPMTLEHLSTTLQALQATGRAIDIDDIAHLKSI